MASKTVATLSLKLLVSTALILYLLQYLVLWDHLHLADGTVLKGRVSNITSEHIQFISANQEKIMVIPRHQVAHTQGQTPQIIWGLYGVLAGLHGEVFLAGVGLLALVVALNSLRLCWLFLPQQIAFSFLYSLKINFIGNFFNNFLPGSTGGDVVKAIYVAKQAKEQKGRALMGVAVDRVIGLTGLVMLAATTLLLFTHEREMQQVSWVIFGLLFALIITAGVFYKIPESRFSSYHFLQRWVSYVLVYRNYPGILCRSLALTLVIHSLVNLAVFTFALALGIEKVPWYVFFVYVPVGFLAMSLPISLAGWGVGEVTYAYLFAQYDVVTSQAVVLSILVRGGLMLVSLFGGVYWLKDWLWSSKVRT